VAGSGNGRLTEIYDRLYAVYGPQRWWPGNSEFEIIAGAILTQAAAWSNVERALANLKAAAAISPQGIAALSEGELAELIRPSGYYNAKGRKLKAFVRLLDARAGRDLERLLALPAAELRTLLLATHGIGPETADAILLYAAGRPASIRYRCLYPPHVLPARAIAGNRQLRELAEAVQRVAAARRENLQRISRAHRAAREGSVQKAPALSRLPAVCHLPDRRCRDRLLAGPVGGLVKGWFTLTSPAFGCCNRRQVSSS